MTKIWLKPVLQFDMLRKAVLVSASFAPRVKRADPGEGNARAFSGAKRNHLSYILK